ncbi:MAG TPA: MraY family glycosyltransferase [Mycobacteriales bacterium]|nr:MraY family glycosyltransferase [Mycobacteriales bacterium]
MREYALVFCVAAAVTFLLTPVVRRLAMRSGVVKQPSAGGVHTIPTPELGGIAMYAGVAAALLVAHKMPTLQRTFQNSSATTAILIAAGLMCFIGALDDKWDLDALTRFAGMIVAAGVMVLMGVQLFLFYVPFGGIGTVLLGRDEAVPLTILFCVATVNAVNWIDGLDGLAAGVTCISAVAFFAYSYHLGVVGYGDVAYPPTLICAVTAGVCAGFLPHNFSPARIFMGDSGAYMLGLLLASATTTATNADSQTFGSLAGSLPLVLPLVIPALVLAIPLGDMLVVIARRLRSGKAPWASADRKVHLPHRMLKLGHTPRRTVLIIYLWAALIAFGGVAMTLTDSITMVLSLVAGLAVVALVLSNVPRLRALRRTGRA